MIQSRVSHLIRTENHLELLLSSQLTEHPSSSVCFLCSQWSTVCSSAINGGGTEHKEVHRICTLHIKTHSCTQWMGRQPQTLTYFHMRRRTGKHTLTHTLTHM